jgi:type III secretion protein Q
VALAHLPDCRDGVPDLPVWLHVRRGCALVTAADLTAARAGDVIPIDTLPDGDLLLVLGERFVWRARGEDAGLRLLTPKLRPRAIGLERWMMDEAIEDDAAELDDLPVRLAFELGRLELPLAEVTTLGVGHVFELARDVAQPVDILANGRRIGRGRIVDVAGSLGVQIVRIGRE